MHSGPRLDEASLKMPFKMEDLILEGHASTIGNRRLVLPCLENRWVSGSGRIGAATQAVLIERRG